MRKDMIRNNPEQAATMDDSFASPTKKGVEFGAKHTPAPWSLPHFAEPDCNCECGYVLTDHMMGAVCTVHASGAGDDWMSHGENPRYSAAVANARLISAAPELLEAVAAILGAARQLGLERGRGPSRLRAALELGEAAVSRAMGGDEPWKLMLNEIDMSPKAFRERTDAARSSTGDGDAKLSSTKDERPDNSGLESPTPPTTEAGR